MPSNIITPYSKIDCACTVLNTTHTIFTTPQPGFVMMCQAWLVTATSVSAPPTVSFGTGSGADWDDIIPDTALTGMTTADEMWTFQLTNGTSLKPLGNAEVRMKVQAAATATAYVLGVVIYFAEAPFGAGA